MKQDLNKAIKEIRAMRMTASERDALRTRIIRSTFGADESRQTGGADIEPGKYGKNDYRGSVESPWNVYSFGSWVSKSKIGAISVAALALIILGGGGAAYASEKSLPGDVLYPIKTGLVEPLRGTFASSPGEDAAWRAELITRRLTEAQALAAEGRLNRQNQQKLEELLDDHNDKYILALQEVEKKESPEKAEGIGTTLRASLIAHARSFNELVSISEIADDDTAPSAVMSVPASATASVSGTENSIAARKASDTEDMPPTSTGARMSNQAAKNSSTKSKSSKNLSEDQIRQNAEAAKYFGNKTEEHILDMRSSWKSPSELENIPDSDRDNSTGTDDTSLNQKGASQSASVNAAVISTTSPIGDDAPESRGKSRGVNENRGGKKNN